LQKSVSEAHTVDRVLFNDRQMRCFRLTGFLNASVQHPGNYPPLYYGQFPEFSHSPDMLTMV